jgi:hypothetical protein
MSQVILLAAAGDINPKRQRGLQIISSLTIRVSVECLTPDRAEYRRRFARAPDGSMIDLNSEGGGMSNKSGTRSIGASGGSIQRAESSAVANQDRA